MLKRTTWLLTVCAALLVSPVLLRPASAHTIAALSFGRLACTFPVFTTPSLTAVNITSLFVSGTFSAIPSPPVLVNSGHFLPVLINNSVFPPIMTSGASLLPTLVTNMPSQPALPSTVSSSLTSPNAPQSQPISCTVTSITIIVF